MPPPLQSYSKDVPTNSLSTAPAFRSCAFAVPIALNTGLKTVNKQQKASDNYFSLIVSALCMCPVHTMHHSARLLCCPRMADLNPPSPCSQPFLPGSLLSASPVSKDTLRYVEGFRRFTWYKVTCLQLHWVSHTAQSREDADHHCLRVGLVQGKEPNVPAVR